MVCPKYEIRDADWSISRQYFKWTNQHPVFSGSLLQHLYYLLICVNDQNAYIYEINFELFV